MVPEKVLPVMEDDDVLCHVPEQRTSHLHFRCSLDDGRDLNAGRFRMQRTDSIFNVVELGDTVHPSRGQIVRTRRERRRADRL